MYRKEYEELMLVHVSIQQPRVMVVADFRVKRSATGGVSKRKYRGSWIFLRSVDSSRLVRALLRMNFQHLWPHIFEMSISSQNCF